MGHIDRTRELVFVSERGEHGSPRPLAPRRPIAGGELYQQLLPHCDARLAMRPGIAGWAQADGLGDPTDDSGPARTRVDYDIACIQNFSFRPDLKILFTTLRHEFVVGSAD